MRFKSAATVSNASCRPSTLANNTCKRTTNTEVDESSLRGEEGGVARQNAVARARRCAHEHPPVVSALRGRNVRSVVRKQTTRIVAREAGALLCRAVHSPASTRTDSGERRVTWHRLRRSSRRTCVRCLAARSPTSAPAPDCSTHARIEQCVCADSNERSIEPARSGEVEDEIEATQDGKQLCVHRRRKFVRSPDFAELVVHQHALLAHATKMLSSISRNAENGWKRKPSGLMIAGSALTSDAKRRSSHAASNTIIG